jgi:hypothetical protein
MKSTLLLAAAVLLACTAASGQVQVASSGGGAPAAVASGPAGAEKSVEKKDAARHAAPKTEAPAAEKADAAAAEAVATPRFARWLDLQAATLSLFHFYASNSSRAVTYNQVRHKEVFRGRIKFDAAGRLALNATLSSGQSFTGSLNNAGLGRGQLQTRFTLRQLFLAAKPTLWLEVQAGGLGFTRGESTEATSYDDDAYVTGYRLSLRRPRKLYFDEVTVTAGYLGDFNRLNATARLRRLKEVNYLQVLVAKGFEQRGAFSADFTSASGVCTMRGALRVNARPSRVFDSVRFEAYRRLDLRPDFGYAVRGEKSLARRVTAGGGFARIDRAYGGLNADRFPAGKRLFGTASYTLSPELSLNLFASRAVGNQFAQPTRTRVDLFLTYNLLKTLQKAGWF